MEIWKKINGYENYEISNHGNVKSNNYSKIRILKKEKCKGYLRVSLSKNNRVKRFLVHRLVAMHFIYDSENKPCVNHKDGDKFNNHIYNLEWCTYSENEKHSYNVLKKLNHNRKLSKEQVEDIINNCVRGDRSNIALFPGNVKTYMLKYDVSRDTIFKILNKKHYV